MTPSTKEAHNRKSGNIIQPLSVAVVTPTIGRSELERTIQSVQKQTYPCTHYVFVDGKPFFNDAKTILEKYPQVEPIYLPINTGANNWINSRRSPRFYSKNKLFAI